MAPFTVNHYYNTVLILTFIFILTFQWVWKEQMQSNALLVFITQIIGFSYLIIKKQVYLFLKLEGVLLPK